MWCESKLTEEKKVYYDRPSDIVSLLQAKVSHYSNESVKMLHICGYNTHSHSLIVDLMPGVRSRKEWYCWKNALNLTAEIDCNAKMIAISI